jgi:CUG-BP- and ETR3-like factor
MNYGANKPGSAGCNLFIYYIPTEWDVSNLVEHFNQYGQVISARIVAANGVSKGYGFVTYENADEAKRAIEFSDGFHVPGSKKRLKVSLKTEKQSELEGGAGGLGMEYKYAPY